MDFIAATNNAHKLAEMRRILQRMGHKVVSQKEAGLALDPEEDGDTFAANAAIKARAISQALGKAAIADDSGICVDALDGAPGVHSARYCGRHGDDEANNDQLLAALARVPEGRRGAHFTSAICVWLPDGRHFTFEGLCPGRIGFARKGANGFGYDPLFIPDEVGLDATHTRPNAEGRSYAQLSADEKDAISHRGRALARMERELPALLADETCLAAACSAVLIEVEEPHADE